MADRDPFAIVLGIAQDGGYPQAGCRKRCCARAWADPALRRHVACLGIVDPRTGARWLIDATPDFAAQLHALGVAADEAIESSRPARQSLSGIFLTHGHAGHIAGLLQLGREAMRARRVPVHAMPRLRALLDDNEPWAQLPRQGRVELVTLTAERPVRLGDCLSITPFAVGHRDELTETVGYAVSGPRRSLLYVPDMDRWSDEERGLVSALTGRDTAFVDGTFFSLAEPGIRAGSEVPHPTITESRALLRNLVADTRPIVRFIHLNHTNPALNEASRATAEILADGFGVARQGERVPL